MKKDGTIEGTLKIKRTDNRIRQRANADSRQKGDEVVVGGENDLKLFNVKDLEWLAWNFRAWNNLRKFNSRREMIFSYLNYAQAMLPSPAQILNGIIIAQVNDFSQNEKYK